MRPLDTTAHTPIAQTPSLPITKLATTLSEAGKLDEEQIAALLAISRRGGIGGRRCQPCWMKASAPSPCASTRREASPVWRIRANRHTVLRSARECCSIATVSRHNSGRLGLEQLNKRRSSRASRAIGGADVVMSSSQWDRPIGRFDETGHDGRFPRPVHWSLLHSTGIRAGELGDVFVTEGPAPKRITVTVNKSRTINVGKPFARAMVGSVDYADVVPLSDRAIYIQGKKPGTTNVSLFDSDARLIGVLDLQVTLDTGVVQEKIRGGSGAQGIRVSSVQGQVVLSGTAIDAVAADRAVQVAKSLAGDQPIVNAMQVAPAQQVMLEVRFLEVSRDGRARTWGQLGRECGWKANYQYRPRSCYEKPTAAGITHNRVTQSTVPGRQWYRYNDNYE